MNNARILTASLAFMLIALALLLLQHWGMTFTNSDDPWIVQLGYEKGIMQGSLDAASAQGRFWLVPINILAQLPFLPDNWAFVNSMRILVNGLVVVSFVLFCSKLTNTHTGVLMGLVWLALIDVNSSDFSAIHGYLMMFNLQFIFLFLSFYCFLDRLDKPTDSSLIVVPHLLYAFALLSYEPMFFYSLVFPALFLYRQLQDGTKKFNLLKHAVKFLERNWVLVLVLIVYVLLYFSFRHSLATGTRGVDSGGSLVEVVRTIYAFSIHGFHIALRPFGAMTSVQPLNISVIFAASYAVLIGLGMFLVIPRIDGKLVPTRLYRKPSLLVLGFFIISPNILFGFVEGYRKWAAHDPHYVGNYFSSFPLAMIIALGLLYVVGGNKARQEKILFALILYVFASSACDNYLRWEKLAEVNRRGSAQWQAAMQDLAKRNFATDRATLICSGDPPRQVTGDDKYWSQYLSRKFSANIQFMSRKVSKEQCDVVLDFQNNDL